MLGVGDHQHCQYSQVHCRWLGGIIVVTLTKDSASSNNPEIDTPHNLALQRQGSAHLYTHEPNSWRPPPMCYEVMHELEMLDRKEAPKVLD